LGDGEYIGMRIEAERLRADALKLWFDEWVIKPGDSIPAKVEEGLERSRVLVLCMSAQALGSAWAQCLYINWLPADREKGGLKARKKKASITETKRAPPWGNEQNESKL